MKEDAYRKIHISDTQLSYIFVLVTVKKYLERYIYSQPIFFFFFFGDLLCSVKIDVAYK